MWGFVARARHFNIRLKVDNSEAGQFATHLWTRLSLHLLLAEGESHKMIVKVTNISIRLYAY